MHLMKRFLAYLAFSLLFLVFFLPLGTLLRWLIDPLRLRRDVRAPTYFRMAGSRAPQAQPPQPVDADGGLAGKP